MYPSDAEVIALILIWVHQTENKGWKKICHVYWYMNSSHIADNVLVKNQSSHE